MKTVSKATDNDFGLRRDFKFALIVSAIITFTILATSPLGMTTINYRIKIPFDPDTFQLSLTLVVILLVLIMLARIAIDKPYRILIAVLSPYIIGMLALINYSLAAYWRSSSTLFYETALVSSALLACIWIVLERIEKYMLFQGNSPQCWIRYRNIALWSALILVVIAGGSIAIWIYAMGSSIMASLAMGVNILLVGSPISFLIIGPLGFLTARNRMNKSGITLQNADKISLMGLRSINLVVFDEMFLLTQGNPHVVATYNAGLLTEPGLLRLAASLARSARYVYAGPILKEAEKYVGLTGIPVPDQIVALPGYGIIGKIETRTVILGNDHLMHEQHIDMQSIESSLKYMATRSSKVLFVAVDGHIEGIIAMNDEIKSEALDIIDKIKLSGRKTALITIENKETTEILAKEFGFDMIRAGLLEQEKDLVIREWNKQGYMTMIISAPKGLKFIGSSAAIHSVVVNRDLNISTKIPYADIVLRSDMLNSVIDMFTISRKFMRNQKRAFALAFAYNIAVTALAAGALNKLYGVVVRPDIASALMVLGVIVTSNQFPVRKEPR